MHLIVVFIYLFSFRNDRKTAKSDYQLCHVDCRSLYQSVCPQETTRLNMDGILWNWMFEYFSKICGQNSSVIQILQE